MTDSNVIRLIRRYDPVSANNVAETKARRSLEKAHVDWHSLNSSKPLNSGLSHISSSSCSFLPQNLRHVIPDDRSSVQPQSSNSRLQRQVTIREHEISKTNGTNTNSTMSNKKNILDTVKPEINLPGKQIEPLTIDIEPLVGPTPMIPKTNGNTYQPLIMTATKRVCSGVSKSEWDLRLQPDSPTSIPPTPTISDRSPSPRITNTLKTETSSYRPLFTRSQSTVGNRTPLEEEQQENMDDFDENSAPILPGSSVQRLKKLFVTQSSFDLSNPPLNSQHRVSSVQSNLNGTNLNKTDSISSISSISQKPSNLNSTNIIKSESINPETVTTSSTIPKKSVLKNQQKTVVK